MGYKDDKWQEAPGFCVECDMLRPLNSSAVCEGCHQCSILSNLEDWSENAHTSLRYYETTKARGLMA